VTFEGWEWLEARPNESGKTAFVAMNFDERYQDLQRAIERAINGAGYEPKVASKDLYAGGVMDWVLARIREARFVVADYTENRGGVYYEAGFALGLGKTVIHSCRKQMLDPSNKDECLHFDVAHLKVIPCNEGDLSTYSTDLENHILAVLGRGPVKP
jgi:nucleoside 2-deoxyribosyltransferase